MKSSLTNGVHHIGLTVLQLEESAAFFTEILGWSVVKKNDDYPSVFVSDGQIMLTLWAVTEPRAVLFNRKSNVGLHHLALEVGSDAALNQLYSGLVDHRVDIEFPPTRLGVGPAKHMMCFDPSGIRVEFIWSGQ
jgi:catechol 2,3-dioxygenase-like lactoylglutathione lyase family enzyme